MQRLKTTRVALGLYGALLVLPTLVFGWLYWREIQKDYQAQLDDVPEDAQNAARRIAAGMRAQLEKLIDAETRRPFYYYASVYLPVDAVSDDLPMQPSPLADGRKPQGLVAWFSYSADAPQGDVHVLLGDGLDDEIENTTARRLREVVQGFRERKEQGRFQTLDTASSESESLPLSSVALHLENGANYECLRRCSPLIRGMRVETAVSDFRLEFYVEGDGQARAVAWRRVENAQALKNLPPQAPCMKALEAGFTIEQGFLVDVDWLFRDLPQSIASQALSENDAEELRPAPAALPYDNVGTVFAEILPVRELGFDVDDPQDELYGKLEVSINTGRIEARFQKQSRRFLGVALMLVLTLATGMTLLYRNVRRELEHAHRMQNFVAAVTHELRTPLSTIRLHGEMLLDGWATDMGKQQEYYQRIVRETNRLSTLVERILEKSQLKEGRTEPKPGDLNVVIQRIRPDLEQAEGGEDDLRFELAEGLPMIWLNHDAVSGILTNLVENARKYAPVPEGGEPILVRTRADRGSVLLEVADRGPGVPSSEVDRVFEAFYRVGSEATRTTKGTGLGLHLVQLHAESVGAKASLQPRDGGGSIFRIAFRPA